jgi:hypothetical protein
MYEPCIAKTIPVGTVGELRKLIEGVPDSFQICSDVLEGSDEWTCGVTAITVGIPLHWQGVKGVEPALWFHCEIVPLNDGEPDPEEEGDT